MAKVMVAFRNFANALKLFSPLIKCCFQFCCGETCSNRRAEAATVTPFVMILSVTTNYVLLMVDGRMGMEILMERFLIRDNLLNLRKTCSITSLSNTDSNGLAWDLTWTFLLQRTQRGT
jgi:hypothetical protein